MNWVKQLRVYSNALFLISKNPSPASNVQGDSTRVGSPLLSERPTNTLVLKNWYRPWKHRRLPHPLPGNQRARAHLFCDITRREKKKERERASLKWRRALVTWFTRRVGERGDKDEPRVRICYSRCAVSPSVGPLILIHKRGRSCKTVGRWSVTGRSHRLIYALFVAIAIPVRAVHRGFPSSSRNGARNFRESGTDPMLEPPPDRTISNPFIQKPDFPIRTTDTTTLRHAGRVFSPSPPIVIVDSHDASSFPL